MGAGQIGHRNGLRLAQHEVATARRADPRRFDAKAFGLVPERDDFFALRIKVQGHEIASLVLAKILQDRIMAFNVGLFLVMAYTMLEAAWANGASDAMTIRTWERG
ncbi:MAG: hypothetical protein EOP20_09540, partial [Hyphomicrobiales bacterium]